MVQRLSSHDFSLSQFHIKTYLLIGIALCFHFFDTTTVNSNTPLENIGVAEIAQQSHYINFPINISFELIGKSHQEIDEILFYYRLANTNISGYKHASISRRDSPTGKDGFTATSKLATSGSEYIPSGTQISYYFKILYVNEAEQETDPITFDYLNPKYRWQKMETENMTVFWHDITKNKIEEVISKSGIVLEQVFDLFDLEQKRTMRAVIANTQKESAESFPKISSSATRDNLYGGFAFPEYEVFIVRGINADGIIHEATHLLMSQKLDSAQSKIPAWLSEGIAMYFEIDNGHRNRTAEIGYLQKQLRPLSSMQSIPGKSADVRLFYAHSQGIVAYLIDKGGKENILRLFEQINSGTKPDAAVINVYGATIDELDKSWQATLNPRFERRMLVDPGTFWTSLILGTVFLFAVIVSAITWTKKKISNHPESIDETFEIPNINGDRWQR